jgi:hypothetical protein
MTLEKRLINNPSEVNCRNCASANISIVQSGYLADFFLKRVFGIDCFSIDQEIKTILKTNRIKKTILIIIYYTFNLVPSFRKFFNKKPRVSTEIRVCMDCDFIGPNIAYSIELLNGIYHDYRSDTYNSDRSMYEPEYEKIQHIVGKNEAEMKNRLENVEEILKKHINFSEIKNVLDWGGGEGRFIPQCFIGKEIVILDVSDEPLINKNYKRISEPINSIKYDYIQVCHVLEHISEPLQLLKNIVNHSSNYGYVYIELPQDRSDHDIKLFQKDPINMEHIIHEHLNLYSVNAIEALGKAVGLEVICVEKNLVNLGWHKVNIISGLFRIKNSK